MMAADSLVNRLHINPKHELASNTPFMLRMLFKKEMIYQKNRYS